MSHTPRPTEENTRAVVKGPPVPDSNMLDDATEIAIDNLLWDYGSDKYHASREALRKRVHSLVHEARSEEPHIQRELVPDLGCTLPESRSLSSPAGDNPNYNPDVAIKLWQGELIKAEAALAEANAEIERLKSGLSSPELSELRKELDDLLFAWLYAHQDAMARRIPAEDVTPPYEAIQSRFASLLRERDTAVKAHGTLWEENERLREAVEMFKDDQIQHAAELSRLRESQLTLERENARLRTIYSVCPNCDTSWTNGEFAAEIARLRESELTPAEAALAYDALHDSIAFTRSPRISEETSALEKLDRLQMRSAK